jgi:hypothetical protein
LSIPKGGIGDEDLFGGIDEYKLIIEFYTANLFVRKDIPIEVWFLDIQERVLLNRRFAVKSPLLPHNGHSCLPLLSPLPPSLTSSKDGTELTPLV